MFDFLGKKISTPLCFLIIFFVVLIVGIMIFWNLYDLINITTNRVNFEKVENSYFEE